MDIKTFALETVKRYYPKVPRWVNVDLFYENMTNHVIKTIEKSLEEDGPYEWANLLLSELMDPLYSSQSGRFDDEELREYMIVIPWDFLSEEQKKSVKECDDPYIVEKYYGEGVDELESLL
jgi:hypothetical protein